MSYSELLEKAKQHSINPIDLMIAAEVDFHLRSLIGADLAFESANYWPVHESICEAVRDIYLSTDGSSIEGVTRSVFKALKSDSLWQPTSASEEQQR
jgi:hypothetical protein